MRLLLSLSIGSMELVAAVLATLIDHFQLRWVMVAEDAGGSAVGGSAAAGLRMWLAMCGRTCGSAPSNGTYVT